ncbi:discoidin domain-containing protein, partial [Paenibacillus sp. TAF58]
VRNLCAGDGRPNRQASNDGSVDTASWAFDGNFTTRFGSKRGLDPGWLYVDLGESKRINEVRLYWEAAYGKSYQIQVSDDAENWNNVFSTTSGKGALETIAFNEVSARYVRMYGTVRATQYGYSIWELEVYGPEVLADSITLDKTKLDMLTGMTEQLTATLLPENTTNKKAFWTTSNPNVASVNGSGLVTATGTGTAAITAATSNGELLATAAVTVTGIGTPSLHAAIAGDRQVSLSWDAVEGATSYQIFSRDAAGSYGAALATVNSSANSYKAEGLSNGTNYFFMIKAVYPGGESAASNEVSTTPQVAPVLDFVAPEDANIHYMGRWDRSSSTTYKSYWPGASLRVNFTGTNVQIKMGASANLYAKVDDGPYVLYKNANGTVPVTSTPLSAGTHTLTVVSKDIMDVLSFQGLLLDSGATTVQASPREHLIEFIGDSITVGYTTPEVSIGSYAWLAGEQLNADHTQIAYTGICLETGVACYAPNSLGMSEQYFKLQPGDYPDSPDWNFSSYQPDAIVINLGTNDAKFNVPDSNFQSTYTAFLQQIRTKYPSAQLFVLRTFGGFKASPTLAAVNSRIAAGDAKLHYVDTSGWIDSYPSSDFNDSLHPSSAGHVKIASRLAQLIQPYLEPFEPPVKAPELQDITGKKAGDTVIITGHTELSTLTIKVLRPDQSILYVNVLTGGNFSDSFTLPNDAIIGTYTIVAGSGDVRTVKRFEVIEEPGSGSEVLADEISLNPSIYTMAVGSQAQFIATVLPIEATNKTVTWSVYNETGQAQIDQQGVLTAIQAGVVTVKAVAKDGSGIVGTSLVTITQKNDGGDNASSNSGGNNNNVLPSVTPVTLVMKDGMAIVQLDEKQTSTLVSMNDIQDRPLQVKVGGAAVTIDQTELKYLLSQAGTTEEAMIQVKVEPVADNVSQTEQGAALLRI